MENRAASLRDCLWEQHSKHIKALMLIIISILCAALICLTGCVSSSSDENSSSESSSSESATEEYTNEEAGFTVSLPSYWIEEDVEDTHGDTVTATTMKFNYDDGDDSAVIYCTAFSGFEDISFSDLTKEAVAELGSASVDDVSKKKLSSGSYYLVKTYMSIEDYSIPMQYVTIKNDYLIHFMYGSVNENEPHLSDFEEMVDSVKYE